MTAFLGMATIGCSGTPKDDEVVATVNGKDITAKQYKINLELYKKSIESLYGTSIWETEIEDGVKYKDKLKYTPPKIISDKDNTIEIDEKSSNISITIKGKNNTIKIKNKINNGKLNIYVSGDNNEIIIENTIIVQNLEIKNCCNN